MKEGQAQTRAVRDYLAALERPRFNPDRVERMKLQLKEAQQSLDVDVLDPIDRLLVMSRIDNLSTTLDEVEDDDGFAELEAAFVKHAAAYAERKGVSYFVWRQAGVPAPTLKAAGISRS